MEDLSEYLPCPNCGNDDPKKVVENELPNPGIDLKQEDLPGVNPPKSTQPMHPERIVLCDVCGQGLHADLAPDR